MLLLLGGIVVLITVYCLVKQYESRMVLFCAGVVLAFMAGDFMGPFKAFSHAMLETKLFESIVSVMGFAMVMKVTECDKHLINLLIKPLKKAGPLLIPATTLVTLFINTSITSSAGCSAAVGSILIPLLMAAGIHPAIAAAAIYAGTYGAIFNPGYAQVAIVVNVAKSTPVAVVANHFTALLTAGVIGAFSLLVVAYLRKENKGYELSAEKVAEDVTGAFKVNLLRAFMPLLPIVILVTGSMNVIAAFKPLQISHAMIIGVFCAFIVTRVNPAKISKEFWHGVGDSFGHVFGIIICALVFVGGMQSVGLIKALIDLMVANPSIAKISSAAGPFILGVMSGSGDAAAVAFNKAVTPEAVKFGLSAMDMGSMAAIGGALGRSMSPVAGGLIICAGLAGVSPMEVAKRNAPGMVLACVATLILLLYK
ncbi:C4-dicarboxylate ABC transporter [Anaerosporomusa subterranea]|uniref:C4-dicarboxylate ABC transporter n=1 Tax=Anaerosporomusa subterranea TaxID=1794912 RepID=A0A154BQJ0_ANASB|nr:C4-dicarboxylate transporter DcuC [Anaerosporomusa subterranea]KYZ76169.1 C4-dicarboxylate ABC transporter [Anaerosporomusa subterranea]